MNVSSIAVVVVGLLAATTAITTDKVPAKAFGDLIEKLRQEVLTGQAEFYPLTFTYHHDSLRSDYDVKVTGGKIDTFNIERSGGLSMARNEERLFVQVPIAIEQLTLEHEIQCLVDFGDGPNFYRVNGTTAGRMTAMIQLYVAQASSDRCTAEVASVDVTSAAPVYLLDMSNLGGTAAMKRACTRATVWEATDFLKENFHTNFPRAMAKFLTSQLTTSLKDFNLC